MLGPRTLEIEGCEGGASQWEWQLCKEKRDQMGTFLLRFSGAHGAALVRRGLRNMRGGKELQLQAAPSPEAQGGGRGQQATRTLSSAPIRGPVWREDRRPAQGLRRGRVRVSQIDTQGPGHFGEGRKALVHTAHELGCQPGHPHRPVLGTELSSGAMPRAHLPPWASGVRGACLQAQPGQGERPLLGARGGGR